MTDAERYTDLCQRNAEQCERRANSFWVIVTGRCSFWNLQARDWWAAHTGFQGAERLLNEAEERGAERVRQELRAALEEEEVAA